MRITKAFSFIISFIMAFTLIMSVTGIEADAYASKAKDVELPYGAGVFSWRELPGEEEVACLVKNGITEIYQFISSSWSFEEVSEFLELMSDNDIDVYALEGGARWALNSSYDELEEFVSEIDELNDRVDRREQIKGVVLDVEPYGLSDWDEKADDILAQYRRNIVRLKRTTDLEICTCIPFAYDTGGHTEQLKKLIWAADTVLVMNYCRGAEIASIRNEAAFASLYGKRLVNIYELQPAEVTGYEAITYNAAGLGALWKNYAELLDAFPGQELAVAYHTIEYLIEMSE